MQTVQHPHKIFPMERALAIYEKVSPFLTRDMQWNNVDRQYQKPTFDQFCRHYNLETR